MIQKLARRGFSIATSQQVCRPRLDRTFDAEGMLGLQFEIHRLHLAVAQAVRYAQFQTGSGDKLGIENTVEYRGIVRGRFPIAQPIDFRASRPRALTPPYQEGLTRNCFPLDD